MNLLIWWIFEPNIFGWLKLTFGIHLYYKRWMFLWWLLLSCAREWQLHIKHLLHNLTLKLSMRKEHKMAQWRPLEWHVEHYSNGDNSSFPFWPSVSLSCHSLPLLPSAPSTYQATGLAHTSQSSLTAHLLSELHCSPFSSLLRMDILASVQRSAPPKTYRALTKTSHCSFFMHLNCSLCVAFTLKDMAFSSGKIDGL